MARITILFFLLFQTTLVKILAKNAYWYLLGPFLDNWCPQQIPVDCMENQMLHLKKNKTALGIWHFKAKYYFKIMHYCNVWWGNNDSGGTNST